MSETDSKADSGLPGCRLAIFIGLIVLAVPVVYIVRLELWRRHELAGIHRMAVEAQRLGGDASIPPGSVDYLARKIGLLVELTSPHAGDEEFARLASMPAFKHLHTLNLSDTRITDKSLQRLEYNPTLTGIVLSRTKITDKGLESIVTLPWLSVLYMAGTDVTDRGIDTLVKRSGSWQLLSIDLTDTKVTAEGVRKLSKAFGSIFIKHPATGYPHGEKKN